MLLLEACYKDAFLKKKIKSLDWKKKDSHSAPALGRGGEEAGTDARRDHRISLQSEQMVQSQ